MSDIRWMGNKATEALCCQICDSRGTKEMVLSVKNPLPYSEYLDLYRCKECKTCFYHPVELPKYDGDPGSDKSLRYYIETGAGIQPMITTLAGVKRNRISSFLDVGCGFGFTVDFAAKILGWESVGVEPSATGRAGSEILGIPIYNDYLQDVKELEGRKFDLIYSSEVIEHTDNPLGFLETLKGYLGEGGILVLTTPNSDCVHDRSGHPRLLAALSPGYHMLLFSARSIRMLLKKAGFTSVRVEKTLYGIVAYASMHKFSVRVRAQDVSELYLDYLTKTFEHRTERDSLYDGIGYRLFKELIHSNKHEKAEQVLAGIAESFKQKYGEHILDPCRVLEHAGKAGTFEEFGEIFPYNICGVYFYSGILHLRHHKDPARAADLFTHGFNLALKGLSVGRAYLIEEGELLWKYKLYEGISHLLRARSSFSFILDNRGKNKEEFCNLAPLPDTVAYSWYNAAALRVAALYPQLTDAILPRGSRRRKIAAAAMRTLLLRKSP